MGDHRTARRAAAVLNIGAPTTVAFAVAFTGAHTYANAGQNRKPAGRAELAQQLVRERAQAAELARENRRLRRTIAHQPTVAEALTIASVVYGVPRSSLSAVAWCESTHRPWARNGRYRGLFQQGPMFEATPFGRAGLSVWSPYAAALSTAYTVRAQGWRQWECKP